MLTVAEVARRLGMKEGTIRLWLAQRKLPYVRCGRAIRVPNEVVEEFIKKNTVSARVGSHGAR